MPHLFSKLVFRRKAPERVGAAAVSPAVKPSTFQPLALPDDLRSNPFSRATFSPPPSDQTQMETASKPGQGFRLMDLPPELRQRILAFCLGTRTLACRFNGENLSYRIWPQGNHAAGGNSKQSTLALLRTSRQLSKEAMDALLNCSTFIVTVEAEKDKYSTLHPSIQSTIRTLPPSTVRHAVFYFDAWGSVELEVCRQAMLVFTNLRVVDLHFDFGCLDCFEDADGGIFDHFLAAKFVRVRAMSSVGYRYEKHLSATKKQYVPRTEVEGFQALLGKFKAVDVSAQQCGAVFPCLMDGSMCDIDTSLLNDDDD